MGIRIRLHIGYGLDISGLDHNTLNNIYAKDAPKWTKKLSEEFILGSKESNNAFVSETYPLKELQKDIPLRDFIHYDSEYGIENKLLLQPYQSKTTWSRYDDDIDYIVALNDSDNREVEMAAKWLELKGTLYPYIGLMRADTDAPFGYSCFWQSCYLDDPRFKDSIAKVPFHLWFVLRELKLTSPEKTTELFLKLRPTLYRYWA